MAAAGQCMPLSWHSSCGSCGCFCWLCACHLCLCFSCNGCCTMAQVIPLMSNADWSPVLACQDRHVRVITGSEVFYEVCLGGPFWVPAQAALGYCTSLRPCCALHLSGPAS